MTFETKWNREIYLALSVLDRLVDLVRMEPYPESQIRFVPLSFRGGLLIKIIFRDGYPQQRIKNFVGFR